MNLAKKITVKNIFGDVKAAVLAMVEDGALPEGKELPIMRVIGKCTGFGIKTTDLGDSVQLKGSFMATNLETGEETRSGVCYLPETAANMIAGMLDDESASAVEFGFDIIAVVNSKSIRNYDYKIVPLIEPTEDDPLSRLGKSLPPPPIAAAALEQKEPAKKATSI